MTKAVIAHTKEGYRVCKSCLLEKPIEEFHVYSCNGGRAYTCSPCFRENERARQRVLWASNSEYRERHNAYGKAVRRGLEPEPIAKPKPVLNPDIRICKVCKKTKSISDYPQKGKYKSNTCKSCSLEIGRIRDRERYENNPNRRMQQRYTALEHRYATYGTTVEEVVETLERQNNKCANTACGVEISLTAPKDQVKRAVVDHNHSTNKFRALLCERCNIALGYYETNPDVMLGLIEYLNFFNSILKET